jgi:hypothetical protein
LPADASEISYTLHSSIDSDEVSVRFRTTAEGVSEFMESPELAEATLVSGMNPSHSPPRDAPLHGPETYGWDLASISSYAGVSVNSDQDQSWSGVLVDLRRSASPIVYAYALGCC